VTSTSNNGSSSTIPENSKSVPPSDDASDALRGAAIRTLEQEKARGNSLGISFVLSRPLPLKPGDSIPFRLSMPLLSWLDSQSQSRKSVCPQGELLVKSSYSHLNLDMEKSIGLSKMPADSSGSMKSSQASTEDRVRKVQMNGTETWTEFVGSAEQASSIITASVDTILLVGQDTMDMSQTWTLKIQGPIPKSFLISIPQEWQKEIQSNGDSTPFFLEGSPVSSEPVDLGLAPSPQQTEDNTDSQQALLRIMVPERLREWRASDSVISLKVLKKTMRPGEPQVNAFDFENRLPVLMVDNAKNHLSIQRFTGEIRFPSNLLVRMIKPMAASALTTSEVVDGLTAIPFDCTGEDPIVRGSVLVDLGQQDRSIKVESAWLQSISNAVERRERLVLRFQTQANSIALKLPSERRSNSKVILNGSKAKVIEDQENPDRIEILLPSAPESVPVRDVSYVLEIFSWPSARSDWIISLQPDFPSIENSKYDFPIMWQIIVPATSHLVGSSNGLLPGYSWSWRDLWSNRLSDLDQVALERQMGSTSQPVVSQYTNQYLFYALSQRSPMQVWLAPRYLLWVPVALCMLLGTVAVMELRWLQRPWLAIFVLAVCLGFTMWDWDFAAAIVQCMILAMGVGFLYSSLKWLLDRQTRRRTIFANRSVQPTSTALAGNAPLSGSSPKIQSPTGVASDSRRNVQTAEPPSPMQARQAVSATSATTTAPNVLGNPSEAS